jgi:lysophospholipase L1-like esterase
MNSNPNAKRIVCFGDSLTWGYIPATGHERFPADKRWTGILQQLLGDDYEIIEEGLNSRTLTSEDTRPGKEGRNGSSAIIPCLDTHDPIDLVIIMLGTNELKDSFASNLDSILESFENNYVKTITERESQFRGTTPKLLIMSPPHIDTSKEYAKKRYAHSASKSTGLKSGYETIAKKYGAEFLDSNEFVTTGDDGVHITEESHEKLAQKLTALVKQIV